MASLTNLQSTYITIFVDVFVKFTIKCNNLFRKYVILVYQFDKSVVLYVCYVWIHSFCFWVPVLVTLTSCVCNYNIMILYIPVMQVGVSLYKTTDVNPYFRGKWMSFKNITVTLCCQDYGRTVSFSELTFEFSIFVHTFCLALTFALTTNNECANYLCIHIWLQNANIR